MIKRKKLKREAILPALRDNEQQKHQVFKNEQPKRGTIIKKSEEWGLEEKQEIK